MKYNYVVLHKVEQKAPSASFGARAAVKGNRHIGVVKKKMKMKVDIERLELSQAKRMSDLKDVVSVAPAMPLKLIRPLRGPRVSAASTVWGIEAVKADKSPYSGKGIKVAVLDTGIDKEHPAFNGVKIVEQDFTGEGNGDKNTHGSHCAGTIFGREVNGKRIGVATGVKDVLIGKVLGENGAGSSETLIQAMQWAVSKGANVISMSLGIDFPGLVDSLIKGGLPADLAASRALQNYRANILLFDTYINFLSSASEKEFSQPVIVVAASGNESKLDISPEYDIGVCPPAVAKGIYSVAALEQSGTDYAVAPFSNSGATLSGPGVDVISSKAGGGLISYSGTSMATPHVAGVAALWMEKLNLARTKIPSKIGVLLQGNCDTSHLKKQKDYLYGWGMVQAPLT